MKKAILIFVMILLVAGGMAVYFVYAGASYDPKEILMIGGVVLVLLFAAFVGVQRIRNVRKSQPAEDELSRQIMKRAAGTSYYLSLYSWLALMFFSDKTKMEISSFIGLGILIMAIEFALSWVYFNFFARLNE